MVPFFSACSSQCRATRLLVLLSLVLPLGCTSQKDITVIRMMGGQQLRFDNRETLRVPVETEPPTIDWSKVSDTTSAMVCDNIMAGLVQFDLDDANLKLLPSLAKSWSSKDSAKTWVFQIRDDVKWTDGVPLTPQHILDGFHRLLDPKTASDVPNFLFPVLNAQDYNSGKKSWEEVGFKISAPNEITITLAQPMGYFPMLLANVATYPIRYDLIQKYGDAWVEPKNLVTLGPFRLRDWAHDKAMVYDSNPDFFEGEPKIKHIVMYIIQEPQTSISLFNAGKLDSVYHLPSVQLKLLRKRPEYRETSTMVLTYYGFNVEKAPLTNVHLRKAIVQAIDRSEIIKILDGGQQALSGWLPPGIMGYDPNVGLKFDVKKAKENLTLALKELGLKSEEDLKRIEIRFNTSEDYQKIGENMQAQVRRNLGLKVELKNEEWKVYLTALKADPPQIYRFGWAADYPDPDNFMQVMLSGSENNRSRWKNKKYDQIVAQAGVETNLETRKKLYYEAQRLLTEEDAAVIPLFAGVTHMLVGQRVLKAPFNHLDAYEYKHTELKP